MAGEWLNQLPDDLKTNESLTGYATLGDFTKAHLEAQGKLKESDGKVKEFEGKVVDLEGRLTNSIPKLSDKATDEEKVVYRKAMGVPDKPTEYEFPATEGVQHDEKFVQWAQNLFHKTGVSKGVASQIGQEWDQFMVEMVKAEKEAEEKEKTENEKKFREQFKSEDEFKVGYELSKRFWKKMTETDFDEVYKEVDTWKKPLIMSFIFNTAKAVGEDFSPKGGGPAGGETQVGMKYKGMDKFKGG